MLLHPAQKQIVENKSRFRVLLAGRRFGKTVLAVEEMIYKAVTSENARVVYIAPTFQSARDIAWEQLKKRTSAITSNVNETRLELEIPNKFKGRSKILLRSWDSVETLRGQFFDLIVLDEVAQYKNFWVNWQEVLRPTLTDKEGGALFISTPLGFNHMYDLYNLELTDSEFKSFHFTSYDNPYLPARELDQAKATLPPDRFAQEYEASFQKTQGLVYKEFDREKHLYDELPAGIYQKLGAVDFGYRNPAAVLDARWSGEKLWIENEWYKRERTDVQIAEYVALQKFKQVYPDPENPGAIEELRRHRVNVREVVKGKESIKNGIQQIREMLIRGDLLINKRCVNLIAEFEMYSYEDEKGERNEQENPVKANDHALDALRYLVSSLLPVIQRQAYVDSLPRFAPKVRFNPAR
jgi:PBSX family phage terminase large subunit